MQVFELFFNPKTKEEIIRDSFVYEPENFYEKKLGSLFLMGELIQPLPQNSHFLNNLASLIKKEYYQGGFQKFPETSFREALKKANEFLDLKVKKGDVSWLGNLNFAALSINDFILTFTKIGNFKILLIRDEEVLDIGQNLELQIIEPYPLKIFSNIATGKLGEGDKIVILSKEIFSGFKENNILSQLAKISNEKELKEVLKINKEILSRLSGLCLVLIVSQKLRSKEILNFRFPAQKFSFREIFLLPFYKLGKKIKKEILIMTGKEKKKALSKTKKSPAFLKITKKKIPKKKIALVLSLIFLLLLGFFIFQGEEEKEIKNVQEKLKEARAKIILAEGFLILEEKEKAQVLLREAEKILSPLIKIKSPYQKEAADLKKSVEEYLTNY